MEYLKNKSVLNKYFILFLSIVAFFIFNSPVFAEEKINLIIDGRNIACDPSPQIQNGRTLVPIRIISEELNAKVTWNENDRTVLVEKDNRSVLLKIDSRIVEYQAGSGNYDVIDVQPTIFSDRTFVPLRLISNALGTGIDWNGISRTITVDSSKNSVITNFSKLKFLFPNNKETIIGKTDLQVISTQDLSGNAAEIRFFLLDPKTRKGIVIARGNDIFKKYSWSPETEKQGQQLIIAAIFDENGSFLSGSAISVNISLNTQVILKGVQKDQVITKIPVILSADLNFAPEYIKYQIDYLDKDKSFTSQETDSYGSFKWNPMTEDNGKISIKAIAYDNQDFPYYSQSISLKVGLEKSLSLGGVKAGQTIQNAVTLSAVRNFQVSETQYLLRDPLTNKEKLLASVGYAAYKWLPIPEDSGNKELYVRVKDTSGKTFTSDLIPVTILGTPKMTLEGIGPNQVITGEIKLTGISNVPLNNFQVFLINPGNNTSKVIYSKAALNQELSWTPDSENKGNRIIKAEGYFEGKKISSEEIPVKIYLDQIFTAKPIVDKADFQDLASNLAVKSALKTGMSASLQTAQAILETGWGQSVPVDKYTGKFSYNLFGIKGSGPSGSVTSNTWEEYNGNIFRIDASFRAYNNIEQSWDDHKNLLLSAQRYAQFRDVMHNSTQGAWALKRAGYATDSLYPLKLINIIEKYNLQKLDEVYF